VSDDKFMVGCFAIVVMTIGVVFVRSCTELVQEDYETHRACITAGGTAVGGNCVGARSAAPEADAS